MSRERRLGRGLEALLGRVAAANAEEAHDGTFGEAPPTQAQAHPSGVGIDAPRSAEAPNEASVAPEGRRQHEGPSAGSRTDTPRPDPVPTPARLAEGQTPSPSAPAPAATGPVRVDIHRIDSNPFQPRQQFDATEIQSLADSLRAHGLLQPLVVRCARERYQLIAGERRLQAAAKVGWTDVPVHVVEADDRELAELAIVENLHRKDLNPLEKAASFQEYLQRYSATQEELASRLKLDRSTIANLIRLLELPAPVQEAIRQGKITQGHARALLPLGDEREQVAFCGRIQQEGLSVRRTEALVQETIQRSDAEPLSVIGRDGSSSRLRNPRSEHLASLEQEFRIALGTKVKITHSSRGRGKLVIHFASHQEFERLRQHICGPVTPGSGSQVG